MTRELSLSTPSQLSASPVSSRSAWQFPGQVDVRQLFLGRTIPRAARAYDVAAEKYFGEHARTTEISGCSPKNGKLLAVSEVN